MWQQTLLLALLAARLCICLAFRIVGSPQVSYERHSPVAPQKHAASWQDDVPSPFSTCDCELAQLGVHGGLICEREGTFIVGFDNQGRWVNGGGRVPLSRAQCCRLCADPEEIENSTLAEMPARPTATVVSVGCHASVEHDGVSCESTIGARFVSGFQYAIRLPSLLSVTFYPQGPATCCSPVLMLENGDAWELERCECQRDSEVSCPDGLLLFGYGDFRSAGNGAHVPVAPVECCKACVGHRLHRMDDCEAQNRCSHRGVCVMGACECNRGWGGPDCSKALKSKSWPIWIIWVLIGTCAGFSVCVWGAARHAIDELMEQRRLQREDQEAMLDPLMVQEGEVGDTDSESGSEVGSEEGAETPAHDEQRTATIERRIQLAVQADRAVAAAYAEEQAAAEAEGGDVVVEPSSEPQHRSGTTETARTPTSGDSRTASAGVSPKGDPAPGRVPLDVEAAALQVELSDKFDKAGSTPLLSTVKCSICYDRSVQVVLVPCGHSNLCRRCARRLEHCPYCRKPVLRRQRLYLAD